MTNEELIKKFMDGPLQRYLTGDISFGKFIEVINEQCGTNFRYSDLYPSYLFNQTLKDYKTCSKCGIAQTSTGTCASCAYTQYENKMSECHQYGLCVSHAGDLNKDPFAMPCNICPRKK
jgi:hypothetical protein